MMKPVMICAAAWVLVFQLSSGRAEHAASTPAVTGIVSHVNVVSDKVPDISSIEAWHRSFRLAELSEREKALAAWRTTVMFQHQDDPPREYLHEGGVVQDPFKIFHVYGYSFCSVACSDIAALARTAGLPARGWAIHQHSVPEVFWDGGWHMLDASLINYFPRPDGQIASVEDLMTAIGAWYQKHPEYLGSDRLLREFQRTDGGAGWKRGPELVAASPLLDASGWWPAKTHGWYSTMQEYDGTYDGRRKPYLYEYGYTLGYRLNIQLRSGERLTRNWSNKGLHVNQADGDRPRCLTGRVGAGALNYTPEFGDLAPGRIGNGTWEYEMPVTSSAYRSGALIAENLDVARARVLDPARPGVLIVRMPSSYVYLTGSVELEASVSEGGSVVVSFSDNHGLDWTELARWGQTSRHQLDLSRRVLRRYDYQLKFVLRGADTGLDRLRITHDIQHSQRPLPALGQGTNQIQFRAGPPEGTMTLEGSTKLSSGDRQLTYLSFHPEIDGFDDSLFIRSGQEATLTFPLATPGPMTSLRFGAHYRARDARDGLDFEVSFDGGRQWKAAGRAAGPTAGNSHFVQFTDIPAGQRAALVRYRGTSRNATGIFQFRIDADYLEPFGGFRPVKVTYAWDEEGSSKEHVHVARTVQESYVIECANKPLMKSITVELAD
jgi:hypothetical protein